MSKVIYDNMSIGVLELRITERLQGLEYWGDLNLSRHEYESLNRRLKDAIQNGTARSDLSVLRQYPVCTVTVAVFLMRYEYDDNFWGAFADALDLTLYPQSQGAVGELFLETIRAHQFQVAPQEDKRRYISTLQLQLAAPPDSSLPDLFYTLQNDGNDFFDPHLLLEALTSWRAYLIRKPLQVFLERFRDTRALDLIIRIREVMQTIDSGALPDSPLAEQYLAWRGEEKNARSGQQTGEKDWRPHLIYEADGRGLCVVLPGVPLEKQWIEEVRWKITSNTNKSWQCINQVFAARGIHYTAEGSVAVQPAENYTVELFHAEAEGERLGTREVFGIERGKVLLFDLNGMPLFRSNWLPEQGLILISGPEAQWQTSASIQKEKLYAPMLGEYTAWMLTPMAGYGTLTCVRSGTASAAILQTRSHVQMHYEGATLFMLPISPYQPPLFTDFPAVRILTETEQERESLTLVFAGQKHSLPLKTDETVVLKDFISENPQYGRYSLRIYQGHQLIRFSEFYYVPAIESDYSPDNPWEYMELRSKRFLHFFPPENVSLEFSNATGTETAEGLSIAFSPECTKLEGTLRFQKEDVNVCIGLELPVLPCRWSILDAISPDEILPSSVSVHDFIQKSFLLRTQLYGNCVKDSYTVDLCSANGTEQQVPVLFNSRNTASLALAAFSDTVANIPLPAVLLLRNAKHPNQPVLLLSVTETPEFLIRPTVSKKRNALFFSASQNLPDILGLTMYGNATGTIYLDCSTAELITRKEQSRLRISCLQSLPDGIYIATASSQRESNFLLMGNVPLAVAKNVFAVPSCAKVRPEEVQTPKAYIQQAVYDILRYSSSKTADFAASCSMQVVPSATWREIALDDIDLLELTALAEFAQNHQVSHRMQRQICLLMQRISETILTSHARWQLLCLLVQLHCRQDIFDLCRTQYSLVLFECVGNQASCLEIARELNAYSRELSLLVLEQQQLTIREVLQPNLKLLGQEALFSMLGVPGDVEFSKAQEMRKAFLEQRPGNGVQITLCKELSGDMNVVSETIQIDGGHVQLNYQADQVVDALFFDQNRYVDLYANWAKNTEYLAGTEAFSRQKELIVRAVKDGQKTLIDGLRSLRFGEANWIVEPYARALYARQVEGCMQVLPTVDSYPRFFYLMGISALLFCLRGLPIVSEVLVKSSELFLARAAQVAPRILQRDMVMASTYVYLKKKERSLWQ